MRCHLERQPSGRHPPIKDSNNTTTTASRHRESGIVSESTNLVELADCATNNDIAGFPFYSVIEHNAQSSCLGYGCNSK